MEQHKAMLLLLCILAILRGKVVDWMVEYICPITKYADGWWVLPTIMIAIGILYVIQYERIQAERERWVSRYWTLILLFGGYMLFRFDNHYELYGIGTWSISYMDCAWVCVVIIEIVLYSKRIKKMTERETVECKAKPFITDAPSKEDEMGRGTYAEQLIEKIYATHQSEDASCGSFAILLNEHYGAGKTTFMLQLQGLAEQKKMDVCWFKPWLYDNSKTLIVNFIRVIQEKIGDGDKPLQKMLSRYAQALSSIEKFEWLSAIMPEEASIETQFDEIKEKLQVLKLPIIVLIDDVDRLQNDELLQMLQMVRNMGDFPHIFYIVAGDKEALQNRLREAGMNEPDEYLKKFFNLEISFPADDMNLTAILMKGVTELSGRYTPLRLNDIWDFIKNFRYRYEVFATIRDVKRYLNVLDYTLANLEANNMIGDVSLRDVAEVCMIQCVDSAFYRILRDHREYVLSSQTQNLQVREHFRELFMDRSTKYAVAEAIMMGQDIEPKSEYNMESEIKNKIQNLSDFEQWTKPTKMEIIGRLLEELFPKNHIPEGRNSVGYKTEFFKYFATIYKSTELSNWDIEGMMAQDMLTFKSEVLNAIDEGKAESLRLKMIWYLELFQHDRIDALQKVMAAYEMECYRMKAKKENHKELLYQQSYVGLVAAVFKRRVMENDEKAYAEWKRMSEWLTQVSEHEMRLRVFATIVNDMGGYSSFVFSSIEETKRMVQEYERTFVQKIWMKNKYDAKVYHWIQEYRSVESKISEWIIEALSAQKRKSVFLYHLLQYDGGELRWNKEFIECVFPMNTVFRFETSQWRNLLPDEWKKEFENMVLSGPITNGDIKDREFLKKALKYWKNKKRKDAREY